MKWTYEPGEPFPVLALTQDEAMNEIVNNCMERK